MSKASRLGPLNSLTLARSSWSIFTKNLQGKLNDAETDYITVDTAVGSAQNRSPEGANEEGPDPRKVDTSRDSYAASASVAEVSASYS